MKKIRKVILEAGQNIVRSKKANKSIDYSTDKNLEMRNKNSRKFYRSFKVN